MNRQMNPHRRTADSRRNRPIDPGAIRSIDGGTDRNCYLSEGFGYKEKPASITKIMTLILIFDALEKGNLKLDDIVTTSAYAKSMGGSQVFLEEGETQTVETLIKCIVIASGMMPV